MQYSNAASPKSYSATLWLPLTLMSLIPLLMKCVDRVPSLPLYLFLLLLSGNNGPRPLHINAAKDRAINCIPSPNSISQSATPHNCLDSSPSAISPPISVIDLYSAVYFVFLTVCNSSNPGDIVSKINYSPFNIEMRKLFSLIVNDSFQFHTSKIYDVYPSLLWIYLYISEIYKYIQSSDQ